MTKYMPHPMINTLLRKRSAELRKHSCYSTWYYDKDRKKIVICTTHPGFWIGLHGVATNALQENINALLLEHNMDPITISYIECES